MQNNSISGPRILSLDIETSPIVAHAWSLFKTTIGINQILIPPRTICFAAKFMDERKVHFYSEFHHGRDEMIQAAHDLISEADVLMHYNGDGFDLPNLNKEFLLAGHAPPAPYKSIDLLKVFRKNFRFPSNKLAFVSEQLELAGKLKHEGHELWIKCLNGDPKAWAQMKRYNVQDVRLLEEVYDKIRPWIKSHPHFGLYTGDLECCPTCGGDNRQRRGFAYTGVGKFQQYACNGCGSWYRGNKRIEGTTTTQVR